VGSVLRLFAVVAVVTFALSACSKKEEAKTEGMPSPHEGVAPKKKESVVVVPDSVKGKWKAVKIAVTDKTANKETVYTVNIGSSLTVPDSGLTIAVDAFLPHFTMDGTTLTSQSNEPKNPAAQIRILEGNKEQFKGWLFSLYPTTHSFSHPKYGFTLVDFIPAS